MLPTTCASTAVDVSDVTGYERGLLQIHHRRNDFGDFSHATRGMHGGEAPQISLIFQDINGTGGSAAPGENLAISHHKRFKNQSQLYFEYGSPASYSTLQRFVFKYVYHIGAGAGI